MTVETALALPSLRRGSPRVVAGRRNLGRPIRWAHTSEVPDVARLLKGDELLLVTGMGIGRTRGDQHTFVQTLVRGNAAGLVIELGAVFERLPASLIAEAEASGLPLVELHREVRFVDVTEEIHSAIIARQLAVLRHGNELHRRFTDLLLEGAGVPEILASLASTIGNPVLLEKAGHGVLYHATHQAPTEQVLAAWELWRDRPSEPRGLVVRDVPAPGDRVWGRLVALSLESSIDEFGRLAVEQTAALVALNLLRAEQETVLTTRERGNFLSDVMSGRIAPADAAARAEALGFELRRGAMVPLAVVADPRVREHGALVDAADWPPLWRAMREGLSARGHPAMIGSRGPDGGAWALLAVADAHRRCEAVNEAVDVIHAVVDRTLASAGLVVIVVGDAVTDWGALPGAVGQVADTLEFAFAIPSRRWHDATVPDLDRLLFSLRDESRVRQFSERRLAPVIEHDRNRAAELMPTLEALCSHGWRKAETARALNLSRQSLYPRLTRLEALLDADLDDSKTRVGLELAVLSLRQRYTAR